MSQPIPTFTPERRFVTRAEAAEYLRCSQKTINKMIRDGRIIGYRITERLVRVDLDQVDQMLGKGRS